MAVSFYMDHNVPRSITTGLKLRCVDVVTAFEDNAHWISDSALLDRATQHGRALFSMDDDLLAEAVQRQRGGVLFHGVVYAHQLRVSIGKCIEDLETIAKLAEPEEVVNQILFLPL